MATFVSWAYELARFKDALANRNVEQFFLASVENSREMKTTYTRLGNIQEFLNWLESKAADEASGFEPGAMPTSVGGC